MSAILTKLSEAVKAVQAKFQPAALVIPEKTVGGRVYPQPTFQFMSEVLNGDPDIRSSVDYIKNIALGNGYDITQNEKYTGKTSDGRTASDYIRDQCDDFGIDELMRENMGDVVAFGNGLLWRKNPAKIEELARILPGTIETFQFEKEHGMELLSVKTKNYEFPADELIWFAYNRIGTQPIGTGVLQTLCTPLEMPGGTRASLAEMKNRIMKSMMEQIEKFSAYNELWVLPGIPDNKLSEYLGKIKTLNNDRLAFNKADAKVLQLIPERMRGLDLYAQLIWDSYYLGLGTPYPKLVLGGGRGFTEAAAEASMMMGERAISTLQRYLARGYEHQIFNSWLKEEGLDPKQAKIKLNWQFPDKPKPEVLLPLIEKTWELGGITDEEWRDALMDFGVQLKSAAMPVGLKRKPAPQFPSGAVPPGGQ